MSQALSLAGFQVTLIGRFWVTAEATVMDLCATMFDWAKFRLTKGAVKLHLLLDHDGYLPSYAVITGGKKHEVRLARQMHFAPGAILVFDRGYTDYQWFTSLTEQGVYFVTRLKENADYGVVEKLEVPQDAACYGMKWSFSISLRRRARRPSSGASSFTMRSTIACWCF